MCGICGFIGINDKNLLYKMINKMEHRGPDDEGFFFESDAGLAHKRLSIIDLASGHQPMCDERGRFFIVFNGEIYNYKKLKKKLEEKGVKFKTNSDTEVILYTYIIHGAHGFTAFNGIWAFAIYDKLENKLILCRDHVGVKPLYYYFSNGKLIFASEAKAILEYSGYNFNINYNSIDDYLSLRYICGEETIFENIKQLPAGCLLIFKDHEPELIKYWNYSESEKFYNKTVKADPCVCPNKYAQSLTFEEAQNTFEDLLSNAVEDELISEVPLGVYLSGGVDSSVITALMKKHGEKVLSFSVGFESSIDEIEQAYKISKYLGTEHNSITVTEDDFDELPEVVWHLDQPIGDAIILALYKLSSLASKKVKVVLTGEGADELLGGYVYQKALYMALNSFGKLSDTHVNVLSGIVKLMPEKVLNSLFNYPAKLGGEGKERLVKFIKNLKSKNSVADKYLSLASLFSKEDKENMYTPEFKNKVSKNNFFKNEINIFFENPAPLIDKIIDFEYKFWLPDNILHKQDKIVMAHGLEGRVPYLEPKIVSFFNCLPLEVKKKFFNNKSILKNIFKKYFPEKFLNARKKAFYIPMETKFKKRLLKITDEYLNETVVRKRNYFNYDYIKNLKTNFNKSPFIVSKKIMSLAILEMWHQVFNK